MDNLNVVVMEPIKVMAIKIWSYIPAIAGAIIILVVGWLLAKLIETIVATRSVFPKCWHREI